MSTAFLRMPARLSASIRSGPGALARASSSAASASASRSILGRGGLDRSGHGYDASADTRSGLQGAKPARLPADVGARACRPPNPPHSRPADRPLDPGFGMGALWALVVSMLESFRSRRRRNRYHPRLAVGAARTVDWQQLWIRSCPRHIQKIASTETRSIRYLTKRHQNPVPRVAVFQL